MNIKSIFDSTRILLNDIKHNTNSSHDDTFFGDQSFMLYLNDAVTEFDCNTSLTKISYETLDFNVPILSGTSIYDLPENLAVVDTVILVSPDNVHRKLAPVPYDVLEGAPLTNDDYGYYIVDTLQGATLAYSLDYMSGKIRLFPIPTSDWTLKLRGRKYIEEFTLNELYSELPYPKKWHSYFQYYIASRCLEIIDGDAQDIKLAQYYKSKFLEGCRMAKNEQMRLENSVVTIDNGTYNAW